MVAARARFDGQPFGCRTVALHSSQDPDGGVVSRVGDGVVVVACGGSGLVLGLGLDEGGTSARAAMGGR